MVQEDIGQKLLDANLIAANALEKAALQQKNTGGSLTGNLVKIGAISEADLLEFLARLYHVPAADLASYEPDPALTKLIPGDVATKFMALPISRSGRRLLVAMSNPSNIFAIDDIKFITGYEVEPHVASEAALKKALDRAYDSAGTMADVMKGMEEDLAVVEEDDSAEADAGIAGADEAPIVKLVNSLIADAVRKGASDIHIEPYEKSMRVRFRIDGMLHEMMAPPYKFKAAILSRLKIMAELDIAERRVPQDGRIKIKVINRTIDLRVSSLPTIFGEKIVMRILDKTNLNIDLEKLGFEPRPMKDFTSAIASPYGMVLVTGPTGSGKTTTLYSALSRINTPEVNVMTAEDPVEYNLDGINQVLVHEDIGLTFAAALKAFLRQDPNIIMVGEIRDLETASIAVKAALTGHLVLSTLHTNDAASAIGRLIDMGIEPFLVASSVNLILAQRLVRRVCSSCRRPVDLDAEILRELQLDPSEAKGSGLSDGAGCVECSNTGYRGRQGVYEVMTMSPRLRDLTLDRAPASDIKKSAIAEGMLTLRRDGLEKLKRGVTTAEEILKETAADDL
ncbi:MAG: type IV-A pilus assembly ATPase PilB [Candidatus Eisenbacteria bacterium]|uniref:Type IV-A pilus assembly ATPase PilB n=1 Tax=Eiseniibacteriota bacterium TaxID=2212470 RepID=A0A9D6QJ16_UNCEI|nr:type IV-A pilus assembly ATPase PilB [Candidatus Eisenbacteria bacterium]MBI3540052.1 type IV-A pilus assembly ATPase PilB [Candidatus Eisenbacteria bacterium]